MRKYKICIMLHDSCPFFACYSCPMSHKQTSEPYMKIGFGALLTYLAMGKYNNFKENNNNTIFLLKFMKLINIFEDHLVNLQFLWNFDPDNKRFYLDEFTYFNFETLKTKILFHFSAKGLSQDAADGFITNLNKVSEILSKLPKFQLILISVIYGIDLTMKLYMPMFEEQVRAQNQFSNHQTFETRLSSTYKYFTETEIKKGLNSIKNSHLCLEMLKKLLSHFQLLNIFNILIQVIPLAVEMELFRLSNVCKKALMIDRSWKDIQDQDSVDDLL